MTETDNFLQTTSCEQLRGVGPKVKQYLEKLGIFSIQDLLFHLPLRYEDRTHFKSFHEIRAGDHVQIIGRVTETILKKGPRKSLIVKLEQMGRFLTLRFFHFNNAQFQLLNRVGQRLHCYGEVRWSQFGFEMIHPEYHLLLEHEVPDLGDTLTPVYPATEGLSQYTLRKLTDQALLLLEQKNIKDFLPITIKESLNLPDLNQALHYVHRPPVGANLAQLTLGLHACQQRFVFEELLAHQLSLAKIRVRVQSLVSPQMTLHEKLITKFMQQLPYKLTGAQQKVLAEINADLVAAKPMLRLVQGDVGSGKTVVAAIAALKVIESGFQVALMAPTELLAEQHYRNFLQWFSLLDLNVAWLTGQIRGKKRAVVLDEFSTGKTHLVIGTHALFQKDVDFSRLGLIIIDEQHRFGVHQRLALLNKGTYLNYHPNQLIMSATPIPRTLAMTAYADLDCSTIDELPPGRTPVKTTVMSNQHRDELIERIRENCLKGAQVYWVCTLIEESEQLQCQAALEITKALKEKLPELQVELVHGRMKSQEKEQVMALFKTKKIDLLVATTVIEVGVDVPNASFMVIENAERLGLSQLHQLRGRVGRGSVISHCVLMYQTPLSNYAKERLAVLREHTDGFIISQKDLELRGPGEVLGTKQTGSIQFKIADLTRDQHQLPIVQKTAESILNNYDQAVDPLIKRWLGTNDQFSEV